MLTTILKYASPLKQKGKCYLCEQRVCAAPEKKEKKKRRRNLSRLK